MMAVQESRGIYCNKCGWFSLRAAGKRCPGCGSVDDLVERIGITCPACQRPTPSDDPDWRHCLACSTVLPETK